MEGGPDEQYHIRRIGCAQDDGLRERLDSFAVRRETGNREGGSEARTATHGLGLMWIATPSSRRTCTDYSQGPPRMLPTSTRPRRVRHFP